MFFPAELSRRRAGHKVSAVLAILAFSFLGTIGTLAAESTHIPASPALLFADSESPAASSARRASFRSGTVVQRTCCKTCRKGKPCGNSCISRTKSCHRPPGCACAAR